MLSSRAEMPTGGRLRITSIAFPIHMDATRPQNSSGLEVITWGPGWMLWMIMAPTISASTALGGRPSVSMGMKAVCEPELFADSGEATPRMFPSPNRTSPGFSFLFFSTAYAANEDRVAPPPGRTPRNVPISEPRTMAGLIHFHSCLLEYRSPRFTRAVWREETPWRERLEMISP